MRAILQFLLLIFILIPIIEIGVFIQVGDILGLGATLAVVFITAIIGVNLLKQQGIRAWQDIQTTTAQGKMPAIEMASAAQLLFAGGLLLTPGFVTDAIGFALMIPAVRYVIAKRLMNRWGAHMTANTFDASYGEQSQSHFQHKTSEKPKHERSDKGRVVEGEFEEHP